MTTERLTPPSSSWLDEVRTTTLRLTTGGEFTVSINVWQYVSDEEAELDPRDSFVDVPPIDRTGGSLVIRRVGQYSRDVAAGRIAVDGSGLTNIERQMLGNPGGTVRGKSYRAKIPADANPSAHLTEYENRMRAINAAYSGKPVPTPAAV